ncbi:OmpA family protein [Salinimicrobium sp. GXAS 041]|uniref:OmpA family protein n=1 Tax=Salinimicrobium sp. GXAS 041 TaxID=3400806 RepID=UPI003C796D3D
MKHLNTFLLAAFFMLSFTAVQAQDENNPWAIGIGMNAVDFYPTGEDAPLGGYFEDFFNVGDHWNILPGFTRLSVARNIGGGFYFEGAGSVNMIERFGDDSWDRLTYYSLDGTFNYSFRNDANAGWFDPFVGAGGGYSWVDDEGAATLDGTVGLNFWFSDNIALSVQTVYKHAFQDDFNSHFQHVAGIKIAFGGMDTDGDGIYDKNDECPEVAGLPEFNGCPDSDGDGIADRMDACPNEAGLAQFDGCPDTDGDGIPNPQDECPTVAGTVAMNGCPDADGDGVRDSEDECPNEAGPADNNGCPYMDNDNDGVVNEEDECPEVAGTVENNGCPEPTVEVINELNEYSRTILFDLNKATLRGESEETLQAIADIMEEYPTTDFHIEGHTDSTGAESYNQQLSQERAEAVMNFLVEAGISRDRISATGYGESQPIATNGTSEGRQQNRRVEISLEGEQGESTDEMNMNN